MNIERQVYEYLGWIKDTLPEVDDNAALAAAVEMAKAEALQEIAGFLRSVMEGERIYLNIKTEFSDPLDIRHDSTLEIRNLED